MNFRMESLLNNVFCIIVVSMFMIVFLNSLTFRQPAILRYVSHSKRISDSIIPNQNIVRRKNGLQVWMSKVMVSEDSIMSFGDKMDILVRLPTR